MNKEIFRKVSLARLSSPEQLDQVLRVTTPKTWLALLALVCLLGVGVVWGYQGRIATKATGQGVIIRSGSVANVATLGAGRVMEIKVNVGDRVEVNQVVATVGQPAILEKIRVAQAQLEDALREKNNVVRVRSDLIQRQLASIQQQRATLEHQIQVLEQQAKVVAEEIPVNEQLLAKGLITRQQLLAPKQRIAQIQGNIENLRAQITQLNSTQFQTENQGLQTDMQLDAQIASQRRQIAMLEKELEATSKVVSPYSGQVVELKVIPGSLVAVGTPILSLQPDVKTLEAVIYIPATKAKEVHPGMTVELSPSTVKREEFGFIVGKVTSVADYPATEAALMRIFENGPLAQSLASNGPVTEVRVKMDPDPKTPSGFIWSSSRGPNIKVTSGTICTAQVVTREQPPYTLVFPTIKEKLGLS
jgi:HlyD family secretion protein